MISARRTQPGFTLVELCLVSVALVVLSGTIAQSIRSLARAQSALRHEMKCGALVERVVGRMEADAGSATRVFAEGAEGRAYLARLAVGALLRQTHGILPGSRMVVPTVTGRIERDVAGTVTTGNMLLLARTDGARTLDVGDDTSGPVLRRIDVLRVVVWFLHAGSPTGIDLARYCSAPLARLADIEAVADPTRRTRLVQALRAAGIELAWAPDAAAEAAFHLLRADGTVVAQAATELVPPDPEFSEAGILGRRHIGVAANQSVTIPVPRYAQTTANFPHGFEVKHDGTGSGDLILVRLVVSAPDGRGRSMASAEASRQVAFRGE
jgi:hypothetical protein